jgi:hypothetical protein
MNVYTIVLASVNPNLRIFSAPAFDRGSRHPLPSFFSRRIAENDPLLAAETPSQGPSDLIPRLRSYPAI